MKKILLLLTTVLTGVSAWAQPKVSDAPVNGEWAENTTWYTMKNGNGNYISNKHVDDNGNLKWDSNEYTNYDRRAHWCIVGNEIDGYLFYNKAVGAGKALVTTGEEAAARTNFTEVNAATKFYLAESKKAGYWCVRIDKDGNNYWNARGGYLALWNSTDAVNGWQGSGTGDNGSAIMFEIAIDSDDMTELTYVLTDELGTTYTGTYKGVAGVSDPVLEGVAGYTLSDKKWNGNTFTATITFPFPVNEDVVISSYQDSYTKLKFFWTSPNGTNIRAYKDIYPTTANYNSYLWQIVPAFSEGVFSFTIKNAETGKFVYTESTANAHVDNTVVLDEDATSFAVNANKEFVIVGTNQCLSIPSTSGETGKEQFLGTNTSHYGTKTTIYPPLFGVAVDSTGYASLYSPVAATLPENVTVYAVTAAASSKATLTEKEDLPANQGAIVAAKKAGTYMFTIAEATSDWTSNLLKGSATDTEVAAAAYVLASEDGVTAFYKATLTDGKFKNNAGKAYLPASAVTAGARFLSFDFGTETAIESVETVENNAVVYDLAGRRVQGAQKGIFIVNGKKVIK